VRVKSWVAATVLSAAFLLAGGLIFSSAQTVQGELDEVGVVNTLLNHEERITGLEGRADDLQTQVNQNTADIGIVQSATNTSPADPVAIVKTEIVRVEVPPVPEPEPEPAPHVVSAAGRLGEYIADMPCIEIPGYNTGCVPQKAYEGYCDYTYSDGTVVTVKKNGWHTEPPDCEVTDI